MIKKLLFMSILFVGISNLGYSQAFCTPDPNITGDGFHPDSLTNLKEGHVDSLYEELITMIIPSDTTVFPFTVTIDSSVVSSIDGLPASIQYLCGNASCKTLGGQRGCISLFGTLNMADIGTHNLKINATLSGHMGTSVLTYPYPVTFYKLNVTQWVGIENEYSKKEVALFQNTPNPSANTTSILFNSPNADNFTFAVIDCLGNNVYTASVNATSGINTIQLDCSRFAAGVYTYKISNSSVSCSKRLLVN